MRYSYLFDTDAYKLSQWKQYPKDMSGMFSYVSARSGNQFDKTVYAFRIVDFGTQMAIHGSIKDYTSANSLWWEIKDNPSEDWNDYKVRYQELFNSRMTEFRKVAPKHGL